MEKITIFYTGDFHNRLTDKKAEKIKTIKGQGGNALLVDTGDAVGAGNITFRPFGEPILERMSELGYDAMVLGNREFHFLKPILATKIHQAQFPILCANLRAKKSSSVGITPYIIKNLKDNFKVALIGLTVPLVVEKMWWFRWISDFLFFDPVEATKQYMNELASTSNLIIILSHLGLRGDTKVAETVKGIPLIIGGHSHRVLNESLRVKETYIAQAGQYANYLGRIELAVEHGKIKEFKNEIISLDDTLK